MKFPGTNPVQATADWSDVAELQKQFEEVADEINTMAVKSGLAEHVLKYDADRRKQALARAMAAPLAGGATGIKAENEARISPLFEKEFDVLAKQHEAACVVDKEWDAKNTTWKTFQSLLSVQKESIRQL